MIKKTAFLALLTGLLLPVLSCSSSGQTQSRPQQANEIQGTSIRTLPASFVTDTELSPDIAQQSSYDLLRQLYSKHMAELRALEPDVLHIMEVPNGLMLYETGSQTNRFMPSFSRAEHADTETLKNSITNFIAELFPGINRMNPDHSIFITVPHYKNQSQNAEKTGNATGFVVHRYPEHSSYLSAVVKVSDIRSYRSGRLDKETLVSRILFEETQTDQFSQLEHVFSNASITESNTVLGLSQLRFTHLPGLGIVFSNQLGRQPASTANSVAQIRVAGSDIDINPSNIRHIEVFNNGDDNRRMVIHRSDSVQVVRIPGSRTEISGNRPAHLRGDIRSDPGIQAETVDFDIRIHTDSVRSNYFVKLHEGMQSFFTAMRVLSDSLGPALERMHEEMKPVLEDLEKELKPALENLQEEMAPVLEELQQNLASVGTRADSLNRADSEIRRLRGVRTASASQPRVNTRTYFPGAGENAATENTPIIHSGIELLADYIHLLRNYPDEEYFIWISAVRAGSIRFTEQPVSVVRYAVPIGSLREFSAGELSQEALLQSVIIL
ncbi:MAG: apolipoprotein A1/A4/E family protein [Balneolales bacterium]|nr:apolipoprotein A1/A4/E family protein [Balneolales bacterium]